MFDGPSPVSREISFTPESQVLTNPDAFAMDWDGVISDHRNSHQAQKLRPLLLEKSLGSGRPLAVITGKEESDVYQEIVHPCREDIERLGIKFSPRDFLVFTNNGSNVVDVKEAETLERREFTQDEMTAILRTATIQAIMKVYDALDNIYRGVDPNKRESHFRHRDNSTICFRIDEYDLNHSHLSSDITYKLSHLKKGRSKITRFDLAEQIQHELASIGMDYVVVSPTDRSVDLTPGGTGKRQALERFSRTHQISIDSIFRVDDSPTGMGFGLTAPNITRGERQPGYTNVTIDRNLIDRIHSSNQWSGFGAPMEIPSPPGLDQFQKVEWLLNQVTPHASRVFSTLAA